MAGHEEACTTLVQSCSSGETPAQWIASRLRNAQEHVLAPLDAARLTTLESCPEAFFRGAIEILVLRHFCVEYSPESKEFLDIAYKKLVNQLRRQRASVLEFERRLQSMPEYALTAASFEKVLSGIELSSRPGTQRRIYGGLVTPYRDCQSDYDKIQLLIAKSKQ